MLWLAPPGFIKLNTVCSFYVRIGGLAKGFVNPSRIAAIAGSNVADTLREFFR